MREVFGLQVEEMHWISQTNIVLSGSTEYDYAQTVSKCSPRMSLGATCMYLSLIDEVTEHEVDARLTRGSI